MNWQDGCDIIKTQTVKRESPAGEYREKFMLKGSKGEVFIEVLSRLYRPTRVSDGVQDINCPKVKTQSLNDIRWGAPEKNDNNEFCPADEVILKKIIEVCE